jgi:tetratricopeptide (TPR) repeat protein
VPLPPKTHDVLVALVRSAGRLVTKRDLLNLVWPEAFVEEGILAVHISALRKALGSIDGGRFIETVSRTGYRFVSVAPPAAGPIAPEVYERFGAGRAHLLSASRSEVAQAIAAFESAVERDATFAPAHAGLALAFCHQAEFRLAPHRDAYDRAKAAALRALAMEPASADAQTALGAVLFFGEWNWAAAQRCFERAVQLDAGHTEALLLYGRLTEALGELGRGLEWKQRALARDPRSPLVHLQISLSYWNQRRYQDSIDWARRALALDPSHLLAREHLAGAYWKLGDFDRYMQANLEHAAAFGVPADALDELRAIYERGGRPAVVAHALAQMPADGPAIACAMLHAESGNLDEAIRHLRRAIDARDPCLVHLAVAPQWDLFRNDPRFAQCLSEMGLGQLARPAIQ